MNSIIPYDFFPEIERIIILLNHNYDALEESVVLSWRITEKFLLSYLYYGDESQEWLMIWILGEWGKKKFVYLLREIISYRGLHTRLGEIAYFSLCRIEPVPITPYIIYIAPRMPVQLMLAM